MTKVLTFFSAILFLTFTSETNAQRVVLQTSKGEVSICDTREGSCADGDILLFDKAEYVVRINEKPVEASTITVRTTKATESARGGSVQAEVFIVGPTRTGKDRPAAARSAQARTQGNTNAQANQMATLSQAPAMRAPLDNICFINKKTKETVCLSTILSIHRCCWKN